MRASKQGSRHDSVITVHHEHHDHEGFGMSSRVACSRALDECQRAWLAACDVMHSESASSNID
jgi:hypothetical protein